MSKKQQIILLHGSQQFTLEKAEELNLLKGELVIEHGAEGEAGYAKLHTKDGKDGLATFIDENQINVKINDAVTALTETFETHVEEFEAHVEEFNAHVEEFKAHNHDDLYSKLGHTHVSDEITDAVSALTDCTEGSTKLVEGNAVYELDTKLSKAIEDIEKDIEGYNIELTLSGDASGSTTLKFNETGATLSVEVADDSHNHTSAFITDSISALTECTADSTEVVQGKVISELKTELEGAIEANADAIETLIGNVDGDDAKSVREIAIEEVNEFKELLYGSGSTEVIDTLQDVIDWIGQNKEAGEIISDIVELQGTVTGFTSNNTIKDYIDAHIEDFDAHNHDDLYSKLGHTHVSDEITDAVSALTDCTEGSTKLVEGNVVYELDAKLSKAIEDIEKDVEGNYLKDVEVVSHNDSVTVSVANNIATIDVTAMVIDGGEY